MALSVTKWLAMAVLPILAIVGLWNLLRDDKQPPPPENDNPVVAPTDSTPGSGSASPSPAGELDVQILNGSDDTEASNRVKTKLESSDYKVVEVGTPSRNYDRTTIFFQQGFEQQGKQLAQFLTASVTEPAPPTLDKNIPLTVVIGSDYRS